MGSMEQRLERARLKEGRGGKCRHLEEFLFVPPSSCHRATAKAKPACVCAAVWSFCVCTQTCEWCIRSSQSHSQTFRGFHISAFKQIFKRDQEKRKRASQGEKQKERKKERKKAREGQRRHGTSDFAVAGNFSKVFL